MTHAAYKPQRVRWTSTRSLFGRRLRVLAPDPRGQTSAHHTMVGVMLPHWALVRNSLHRYLTPATQGVWVAWQYCPGRSRHVAVAWSVLWLARPARIWRPLQAACRTPMPLSMALLHVTPCILPTQCAAAYTYWTPQAVSLCKLLASTRHDPPPVLVLAAAYGHAPEYSTARLPGSTGRGTFGVAWFGEKHPRGLGRSTPVVWGEAPRGLGRSAP